MVKRQAAVWAGLAFMVAAGVRGEPGETITKFSAVHFQVRVDAEAGVRSWTVRPWVHVTLPQGVEWIKPLILVPTRVLDGEGKSILLPPGKEVVDEKYMLRQQRLAAWENKVDVGMLIPVVGPCPAVLKDVKGELAAEVAEKFTTIEVRIEAGKEFELAPGIKARIETVGPVEMYGRKGLRVGYSYVVPGKHADVLAVQVAGIRIFDAKDNVLPVATRSSGQETATDGGSKIEGGATVTTDTGNAAPTRMEFMVATGVAVQHLPVVAGDVDLRGLEGLKTIKGPVSLPEKVAWLAEGKASDGYYVGISAAKIEINQMNVAFGRRMGDKSVELTWALRPPEGVPALRLVMLGFEGISDAEGKDVQGPNYKLPDERVLNDLARNNRHAPWTMSGKMPMTLHTRTLPQKFAQVKGTAVVVAAGTVRRTDLPLEDATSAELVKGVTVKILKVSHQKNDVSVSYEYDVTLAGGEAAGSCYPRQWIMAEWVDDAGKTHPVGFPANGQGFGTFDDMKETSTGMHGKGTARLQAAEGWNGKIVALRAYGAEGIGLKQVKFELTDVPVMAGVGMSPVE